MHCARLPKASLCIGMYCHLSAPLACNVRLPLHPVPFRFHWVFCCTGTSRLWISIFDLEYLNLIKSLLKRIHFCHDKYQTRPLEKNTQHRQTVDGGNVRILSYKMQRSLQQLVQHKPHNYLLVPRGKSSSTPRANSRSNGLVFKPGPSV